jgi:dTDP-4-dehydrorhamnose reductase
VLVTGGTGQLGSALARLGMHAVGRPEFDFEQPDSVERVFGDAAPTLVVNAAAYTAVDAAETNQAAAWRANRDGPAQLARLCERAGIPLISISTDYVYDGTKGAPYVETDATAPHGIYASTKLAGEEAVLSGCSRAIILRTSWVYAANGRNFIRTMLNAARKTDRLRVVADQFGCPTAAADLAAAIWSITRQIRSTGWQPAYRGIFHAAGTGSTSWYGLACAAFEEAARYGLPQPVVTPITTAEWPTPVRRPPDSRLDCSKLAGTFDQRLPLWRDALARTIDTIFSNEA